MSGHVRRRGERSWELKWSMGSDPATGRRVNKYRSFKGTKRDAEKELVRLMAASDAGDLPDPSKLTMGQFLDRWETWVATLVSAKTLERYRELARSQVRPHLGSHRIQRVKTVHIAEMYGKLQLPKCDGGGGLAPRTVGHVHRVLRRIFGCAQKWGVITANPVTDAEPSRVVTTEIQILGPEQLPDLLWKLRGRPLYPVVVLALATGTRRGELSALRWCDVDFEAGRVRVERSIEQTKGGLASKAPKTKAGRRTISVPKSIVAELQVHWKTQLEQRLLLGLGKSAPDDVVFARADAAIWPPNSITSSWASTVRVLKLPPVTFHALRHTHVSQLIAAGLDVVTVSRRIGHSNPTVTLKVYAHLFGNTDEKAADAVEALLGAALAR